MGKTVTANFVVVYDSQEEYDADLANLNRYEADAAKPGASEPCTQDKSIEGDKLTLRYTITKRIEQPKE